uniref:aspartate/glutamate racemase family protein n=1 Tax=Castellaniella defragrans TaxID=75697 RepID=UPI0033425F06
MTRYSIQSKTQCWYGQDIGILILEAAYPCIPGNVGNAATFDFPVQYLAVRGASIERLLQQADPSLAQPFIEAAQELVRRGARAITGACGFMALFQREVAAAVDVPVLLSSLLQIPLIHTLTRKPVCVITAHSGRLTPAHFAACGVDPAMPLVVAGMEHCEEFRSAILEEKGTLDSDRIREEVLAIAGAARQAHPDIGAILLECSDLPPYAHALQRACGLPVFDYTTLIRYAHLGLAPIGYSEQSCYK